MSTKVAARNAASFLALKTLHEGGEATDNFTAGKVQDSEEEERRGEESRGDYYGLKSNWLEFLNVICTYYLSISIDSFTLICILSITPSPEFSSFFFLPLPLWPLNLFLSL